jgi:phosphate/sulfate permease
MVPVSSSQVIVGCVIGIGLYKGARNINFKLLGEIAIGWLSTPVLSGLLAFFSLFFVKNIFGIDVGHNKSSVGSLPEIVSVTTNSSMSLIFKYLLLGIVASGIVAAFLYYLFERKKNREFRLSEEKFWKNMK